MKKLNCLIFSFEFLPACLCGCSPKTDGVDNVVYHTITFDTDGGSKIASIKVKHGDRIPVPKEIPTKPRREFIQFLIDSGKVSFDISLEYKEGEKIPWWEKYLGEDQGPYLALSDITFKASWKYGVYTIDYAFSSSFYSESLDEITIEAASEVDYGLRNTYYSNLDDLINSSSSVNYEIFLVSKTVLVNEEDLSKTYPSYAEYNIVERKDKFCSLPADYQNWIKEKFDESVYKHVCLAGEVFGFPIFIRDTEVLNKETGEYDLPAKKYLFGVLNKSAFTDDKPVKDEMFEASNKFLKYVSKKANSIE